LPTRSGSVEIRTRIAGFRALPLHHRAWADGKRSVGILAFEKTRPHKHIAIKSIKLTKASINLFV